MRSAGVWNEAGRNAVSGGASGFTTAELESNHLATVIEGAISCRATLLHGGRTTQVRDAVVTAEATRRALAVLRCTQPVLWPR